MREIETKYRVRDLDTLLTALEAAGVKPAEAVLQDDQAYASKGWDASMGKVGHTFARLRTLDGETHVFTTKTPLANSMECVEFETTIANREQMHGAIMAMGFEPTVRIVKHRRTGEAGRIGVCVDLVEGLGAFLELELMVDDDRDGPAAQSELDEWARGLGVELERTDHTYDILLLTAKT